MEPPTKPKPSTHWDNPEFDELTDRALADDADDTANKMQLIKRAYLLAMRKAPLGTITAGKTRIETVFPEIPPDLILTKGSVSRGETITLENMRIMLDEEGLLDDEDLPEQSPTQPQPNKHWDSEEFNKLVNSAHATKDLYKLEEAYLLADREAPWAITAGKVGFAPAWREVITIRGGDPSYMMPLTLTDEVDSYKIHLEVLRRFLKDHGLLDDEDTSEQPQREDHWISPKIVGMITHATKSTNSPLEFVRRLKAVYQFAKDNAPPGTKTIGTKAAGRADFGLHQIRIYPTVIDVGGKEKSIEMRYPIRLEDLRILLVKHDLLNAEDSPEESTSARSPRTPPRIRWWDWMRRAKKEL